MYTLKSQLDEFRVKAEEEILVIVQKFKDDTGFIPSSINIKTLEENVTYLKSVEIETVIKSVDLA